MFLIRAAGPSDMTALRDVFRRSSLSNEGDRRNLLAHPDVLELSDLAVTQGRTRAAVAIGAGKYGPPRPTRSASHHPAWITPQRSR
jgi:hypothetical protein